MNVFTIITIVITGLCLSWSLGLFIFYQVKKHKVEKKAKQDLEGEENAIEERK